MREVDQQKWRVLDSFLLIIPGLFLSQDIQPPMQIKTSPVSPPPKWGLSNDETSKMARENNKPVMKVWCEVCSAAGYFLTWAFTKSFWRHRNNIKFCSYFIQCLQRVNHPLKRKSGYIHLTHVLTNQEHSNRVRLCPTSIVSSIGCKRHIQRAVVPWKNTRILRCIKNPHPLCLPLVELMELPSASAGNSAQCR